jgi:hypothetical protein
MYLIVVYRPFPAAPLVVRCMYMAVVYIYWSYVCVLYGV